MMEEAMNELSTLTTIPAPTILAVASIVAAILLLSRTLLSVAAMGALAVAAWKLDPLQFAAKARHYADGQPGMPLDQLHVAHFGLGLATGVIAFSTLFFVRSFAKAVLVAATLAILYVLATESVPGLLRYAAVALHFLQQFDFFTKGLLAGKFLAVLTKWKQLRRRTGIPT
jgi:hypothetical protein